MFRLKKTVEPRFHVFTFLMDCFVTIIGTFLFAVAIHSFTVPNHLAPGGVTGLSTIISYLTNIPIGLINISLNVPIMIFGLINIGKWFMIKTIVSLLSFTFFMDIVLVNMPTYKGDMILVSIFGGVLMGIGIGLVLSRGGSTGGMDIVNKSILRRFPHLKLSTITLVIDLVVVAISILAFKDITPAFYSIIALYISAYAIDTVLYGLNVCKLMYIVSDNAEEISKHIISKIKRGCTILDGKGAYTDAKKPTILCAVRQSEYFKVKQVIREVDPNAFIMISSATEIVGSGFKSNEL